MIWAFQSREEYYHVTIFKEILVFWGEPNKILLPNPSLDLAPGLSPKIDRTLNLAIWVWNF